MASPSTVEISCVADQASLVVDALARTTILHLPCDVRRVGGNGVGKGAKSWPSFLDLLYLQKLRYTQQKYKRP